MKSKVLILMLLASAVPTTSNTLITGTFIKSKEEKASKNSNSHRCQDDHQEESRILQEAVQNAFQPIRITCALEPTPKRVFDPSIHKQVYKTGVLAIRGPGSALAQHNATFAAYLTATAGNRFDPPISFQMEDLGFQQVFTSAQQKSVDFIYVSPSPFACVEAEYGAESLVSHISKRKVGNQTYRLSKFGGVIAVRADNHGIQSIKDIKGKRVAAAAISAFGSGLVQFREMQNSGMSFINDPSQLTFTSDQGEIVNGVINGDYDVGFIRTDQIQRTKDVNGNLVDPSLLKILQANKYDNIVDGQPFPFTLSTPLYPEWNLAALTATPQDVSEEVQNAILALEQHAQAGFAIDDCLQLQDPTIANNCTNISELVPNARCDTTLEIAQFAKKAMINGGYASFRTTLSYSEIRNLLQDTNFIHKDSQTNKWICAKPAELYDAITCPPGHFKKPKDQVDTDCENAGFVCAENHQCVCSPCLKAFDVDVSPKDMTFRSDGVSTNGNINQYHQLHQTRLQGCAKMAVCGTIEQTKPLVFQAIDNLERINSTMTVRVHSGSTTQNIPTTYDPSSHSHEFIIQDNQVGILVLEIFVNGEQIPESPIRVQIVERDCSSFSGGNDSSSVSSSRRKQNDLMIADVDGICVCRPGTITFGSKCVTYGVFLPSLLTPLAVLCMFVVYLYIEKKKKEADTVWAVEPGDLHFSDPPEILGQGSFGLVLLAEYRGTQVAVKKVLPPKDEMKEQGFPPNSCKSRSFVVGSSGFKSNNNRNEFFSGKDLESGILAKNNGGKEESVGHRSGTASLFLPHSHLMAVDETEICSQPSESKIDTNNDDRKVDAASDDTYFTYLSADEDLDKPKTICSVPSGCMNMERNNKSVDPDIGQGSMRKINNVENDLVSTAKGQEGRSKSTYQHRMNGIVSTGTKSVKFFGKSNKSRSTLSWLNGMLRSNDYNELKKEFIKEMRLLSKLRHPCITTVMGAVIAKGETPMLVMEYMNHGSLHSLLHNETVVLEGEMLLPIMRDIAQGIRFLHAANPQVIHGDLKAANILVDSKFRAKVADFGLSQKKRVGAMGTPYWMAPELLRGETCNTAASDMYSIGIILYEVYSRKDPYKGEDVDEVLQLVCDRRINKRPPIPESCPPEVAKLMKFLFHADPKLRPTARELDNRLRELDVANVQPGEIHLSRQMRKDHGGKTVPTQPTRTSDILYEVFPRHIADILKRGGTVEPETHDMVTIFFSDIVGFTKIAASFPPLKVSNMLDRLYLAFDDLAQKHDVFKIETVGDAYMCAANLAKPQGFDHAKRIAEFAIDAVKAASNILIDIEDHSRGTLAIRVGFHSGPVVSNVVGSLNPRFGIFGDTVNVASRMESTSEKGRIHCSERSATLLRQQAKHILVSLRGDTVIKGKGTMRTYWVNEV